MSWDGNRIYYRENRSYSFDASMSKENKLGDLMTTLNPEAVMSEESGVEDPWSEPFTKLTVESLFERYFPERNNSTNGFFEVYTGQGKLEDLNRIISYDGEK